MAYDIEAERFRCDGCGKFVSFTELTEGSGASWCHVPDSDLSYEEDQLHCRACTREHGMPVPRQTVRLDVCQGMY